MKDTILKISLVLTLAMNAAYANNDGYDCCAPQPCCGLGTFSVGGDWLYWKTEETKLEYGAIIKQTRTGTNTDRAAKALIPKFEYDSGFRVFADYTTCDELWKFSAIYNYIPSKASNAFSSTNIQTDYATLLNVNFNFPILNLIATTQYLYTSIGSDWDSTVNYFDFDTSRTFQVCSNLELIPHGGFRVLWSDQTLRLAGVATDISTTSPLDLSFTGKLSNNISAFGLEGGLNLCWKIYRNFSLVGSVGGSVLYASVHTRGGLEILYENDTSLTPNYKEHDRYGIPMFDAFIGLVYQGCFCKFDWNVHVGWEEHIIFDTNSLSLNNSGNYTLQGLTLGAAVSF
jgi:hypothetical protein